MNRKKIQIILSNALSSALKGKLLKKCGYNWTIDKNGDRKILDARIEIYEFDWDNNFVGGTEDCFKIEALTIFNRKETWVRVDIQI